MADAARAIKSGWGNPIDGVMVTPEQVAAAIARLEVRMEHLTETLDLRVEHLTSAIDGLTRHLKEVDGRVSATEKLTEKAQGVWWSITKSVGWVAGSAGVVAWLLEHGSKFAVVLK